jgi:hypothetical protein
MRMRAVQAHASMTQGRFSAFAFCLMVPEIPNALLPSLRVHACASCIPGNMGLRISHGPYRGTVSLPDIANALFSTPMVVALALALVLDNGLAGSDAERGLTHWQQARRGAGAAKVEAGA